MDNPTIVDACIERKDKLTTFQREIVDECVERKGGCLSVPMGCGKTIMSLELAKGHGSVLVICSKTLIESWTFEIRKFYGDELSVYVFHSQALRSAEMNDRVPKADIVITTPDV